MRCEGGVGFCIWAQRCSKHKLLTLMDLAWMVLDRCFWAICGLLEIFRPFVSCNIKGESIIYAATFGEAENNHNKIMSLRDGKTLFGQVCSQRLDETAFNLFHYCWGLASFKTASFTFGCICNTTDYKKQNPIKPETCKLIQVSSLKREMRKRMQFLTDDTLFMVELNYSTKHKDN